MCKKEVSKTSSSEAFLDDGDKVSHLGELVHEDPNTGVTDQACSIKKKGKSRNCPV